MRTIFLLFATLLAIAASFVEVLEGLPHIRSLFEGETTEKRLIRLGFTPHSPRKEADFLKSFYDKTIIDPANAYLQNHGLGDSLQFETVIPKGGYDAVFRTLTDGDAALAFVSPYNYLHYLYSRKTDIPRGLFDVVAVKRHRQQDVYRAVFITNRYCNTLKSIDDINAANYRDGKFKVVLGIDNTSASTHKVPSIYLLERGIILEGGGFQKAAKHQIVTRVLDHRGNGCLIGALANQDIENLDQQDRSRLNFWSIDIQIPFEPILALKKSWSSRSARERENILKALTLGTNFVHEANDWRHDVFLTYVASGIVVGQENNECRVILPETYFDLWDLNNIWASGVSHRAVVIKFISEIGSTSGAYTTKVLKVGEGRFRKTPSLPNMGELTLDFDNQNMQGLHVIPIEKLPLIEPSLVR